MKLIDGEKLIADLRRYNHETISVDGLEGLIGLQPDVHESVKDADTLSRQAAVECVYRALRMPPLKGVLTDTMSLAIAMVNGSSPIQPDTTTHDSIPAKTGGNDEDRTTDSLISRQVAVYVITKRLYETAFNNVGIKQNIDETLVNVAEDRLENWFDEVPSVQPERKAVFNRDIAIEAICDEVMLWFDISATKAYEIADTAVKRIEVRMEKMNGGERG